MRHPWGTKLMWNGIILYEACKVYVLVDIQVFLFGAEHSELLSH